MKNYFYSRFAFLLPVIFACFVSFGQDAATSNLPTVPFYTPVTVFNLIRLSDSSSWENVKKTIASEIAKFKTSYKNKISPVSFVFLDYHLSGVIVYDFGIKDAFYENLFKTSRETLNNSLNEEVVLSSLYALEALGNPENSLPFKEPIPALEKIVAESKVSSIISSLPNEQDKLLLRTKDDAVRCHFNVLAHLCWHYALSKRKDEACKILKNNMVDCLSSLASLGADTTGLALSLYTAEPNTDTTAPAIDSVAVDETAEEIDMEATPNQDVEPSAFYWIKAAIEETIPLLMKVTGCNFNPKRKE